MFCQKFATNLIHVVSDVNCNDIWLNQFQSEMLPELQVDRLVTLIEHGNFFL